jgi:hypothetical protein
MSKAFNQTLAEAVAALSVVGTGKLRKSTIVSEGPRSFPVVTTPEQEQKPSSAPSVDSNSDDPVAYFLLDLASETLAEWKRSARLHPNTLDLPDGTGGGGRQTWRDQAQNTCDRSAREGRLTFCEVLDEEVGEALAETDPAKLQVELLQVINVSAKWLWRLRRDAARLTSLAGQDDK